VPAKDTVSLKSAAPVIIAAHSGHPFQNEILTNFSSGGFTSSSPCKDCKATTNIGVNLSYLYFLNGYLQDKLQVGAEGGLGSVSVNGNSNTNFNLLGVGAYNLESDYKNSIFFKAGLGLYTVQGTGTGSETKLGLFLGGGKRFAWLSNVTLSPEARIVKKGDLDIGFEFNILNFSIYWN
jgi:opacity protein-like surface antigen